jgi:hypothetical protein
MIVVPWPAPCTISGFEMSTCSVYVPEPTIIVSPALAATMAALMLVKGLDPSSSTKSVARRTRASSPARPGRKGLAGRWFRERTGLVSLRRRRGTAMVQLLGDESEARRRGGEGTLVGTVRFG